MKKLKTCRLKNLPSRFTSVFVLAFIAYPFFLQAQISAVPLSSFAEKKILAAYQVGGASQHFTQKPFILHVSERDTLLRRYMKQRWPQNPSDGVWARKLKQESLFIINKPSFYATIDPLLELRFGRDLNDATQQNLYTNTRGIRATASIGERLYIETNFYENQSFFPKYLNDFVTKYGVVPSAGRVKPFKITGWDYASSTSLVAVKAASFFYIYGGQGNQFIGDGYRSLLMSDNTTGMPYVTGQFRLFNDKLRYSFSYQSLKRLQRVPATLSVEAPLQPKRGSYQYITYAPNPNLEFGLFTAHHWKSWDSTGTRPVILSDFNPILGAGVMSSGFGNNRMNSLVGLQSTWRFAKHYALYTQWLLDNPAKNQGGYQFGVKAHDAFGLSHLNLRLEYNEVRPNTYMNTDAHLSYAHYGQPLATPLGAGHSEWVAQVEYMWRDVFVKAHLSKATYHMDSSFVGVQSDVVNSISFSNTSPTTIADRHHVTLSMGYLLNRETGMSISVDYTRRWSNTLGNYPETSWFSVVFKTQLRNLYNDF